MAVLALGACTPEEKEGYYEVAPAAAFELVKHADIKGFREARQCGMLIYFSTVTTPHSAIAWIVTSGDHPVAKFTVPFTRHDKGTLISIDVPKGPNGAEMYDGTQTYTHPGIMQPLRPAVRELIDSAIERRPYDWRRLPDPLNTDNICGSSRTYFLDSGKPMSIDDPSLVPHDVAETARQRGGRLQVERDQYFGVP